ncbi:hypothetical protein [Actinomadura geliboluensis]|uniref:hypothetical protein n=1 Tax=Actinomadura geliboluensis TaxID=882440 RepID=UPI0037209ECD
MRPAVVISAPSATRDASSNSSDLTWDVRTSAWEFAEQAWFLAQVTSNPVILVSLSLGATVALQVGQLAAQLGTQSATGGAVVVGLVWVLVGRHEGDLGSPSWR